MDTSVFGLSASEIKELARLFNHVPNKQLGQNYLVNPTIVQKMIDALGVADTDLVVEVGGGLGALTLPLANVAHKLLVIEKDALTAKVLHQRLHDFGLEDNVEIITSDILQIPTDQLYGNKMISSVPYSITSPLLHRVVIEWIDRFDTCVFLIQKEMQEKIMAAPPASNYWYHFVNRSFVASIVERVVKPGSFWPAPGVDSIIIMLKKRGDAHDVQKWSDFLHLVFTAPRKQIKHSLSFEVLYNAVVDPQTRPGALSVAEMERLFVIFNETATRSQ